MGMLWRERREHPHTAEERTRWYMKMIEKKVGEPKNPVSTKPQEDWPMFTY